MSPLIDFSDYRPQVSKASAQRPNLPVAPPESDTEDTYRLTLNILVHNNPQKLLFAPKETAVQIGVSEEFIRRRIKSGMIKATYMGDKPMIQITELARIVTEGIK
ncbi:MAG: hypothetical protein LWX56_00745 [Ignavibacteria bacterium]|nr:hypothetical protein [Ignavibacteria bacterium]